jgi:hypothetical protein
MVTPLAVLCALMALPAAIGLLFIFHVFVRSKKPPADASNRINHFRLVWFALTREGLFVGLFPWLKNDEYDNVTKE